MKIKNMGKYFNFIGIFIFIYILYLVGIKNLAKLIVSINITYIVFSTIFIPIICILKGLKLKIVASSFNTNIKLKDSTKIYMIGNYFGNFTPIRAGDFIRIFYLKTYTTFTNSISISVTDRIIEVIGIIIMMLISIFTFGFLKEFYHLILFSLIILLIVWIGLSEKIVTIINMFLKKPLIRARIREIQNKIKKNLYSKNILKFITISVVIWSLSIIQSWFILLSFYKEIPIYVLFFLIPSSILISFIPITISGVGTRDALFFMVFMYLGINPIIGVAFSVLIFLFSTLIYSLIGFILWVKNPLDMARKNI